MNFVCAYLIGAKIVKKSESCSFLCRFLKQKLRKRLRSFCYVKSTPILMWFLTSDCFYIPMESFLSLS